jgi:hypothetical protein
MSSGAVSVVNCVTIHSLLASSCRQTQAVYHAKLRERDEKILMLALRLEQQKRHPGCLDLHSDPQVERNATHIIHDDYVRCLQKENANLICILQQLKTNCNMTKCSKMSACHHQGGLAKVLS